MIMEPFPSYEKITLQMLTVTIFLLIIFPLKSNAFACITCMLPMFHPFCCLIFHTCCTMSKSPNATAT
ncbi:hypothetical protein CEXT_16621 [Caerostris extrusa]|uniref:Uncharacterized protein n=1 Tax=Caerostris extrusa TaxID=172846 RepID=A0AAV4Q6T4_CAEEX|nr:hypothetical protein CEXT_16621 [Caerostris extrusa]